MGPDDEYLWNGLEDARNMLQACQDPVMADGNFDGDISDDDDDDSQVVTDTATDEDSSDSMLDADDEGHYPDYSYLQDETEEDSEEEDAESEVSSVDLVE